jgi:hypothetical protein
LVRVRGNCQGDYGYFEENLEGHIWILPRVLLVVVVVDSPCIYLIFHPLGFEE